MKSLLNKSQKPAKPIDVNKIIGHIQVPDVCKGQDGQQITDVKKKYELAIITGMRFLFDDSHHEAFQKLVKVNIPLDGKLVGGALSVTSTLYQRFRFNEKREEVLPGAIFIPLALVLLLKQFEYYQLIGFPDANKETLAKAVNGLVATILKQKGVAVQDIPKLMEQLTGTVQKDITNG